MLRSGLRRLLIALAAILALTSALSVAVGALAHANLLRALADGFYAVGAAVLVGSFALGLRGPLRAEWGETQEPEEALRRTVLMPKMIRRTTPDERIDATRSSLGLFGVGLVFILIGAAVDPARSAF